MAKLKAAVLILPLLLLAACARSDAGKSTAPLEKYTIHGQIVRLNNDDKTATIHHKDIVGFMKSMTMTFPVKDPKEFSALQVGQCVEGNLFVQGDSFWLANLTHLEVPPDQCVPSAAAEKK